jgi:hypothetical protein
MPLNLASPGIVIREVDLTIGRIDPTSASTSALVAPFAKGPVDSPTLIESENDLLNTFGQPYSVDKHYEHWMVASSYLAYGGTLQVVRADDTDLRNAKVGAASSVKIKSVDHYNELGYDENTITDITFAAKNPGSWANGIRVAIIDGKADQVLTGIVTTTAGEDILVGYGVTQDVFGRTLIGSGSNSTLDGYVRGIVTEIGTDQISLKLLEHVSAAGTVTPVDYVIGGSYNFNNQVIYINENDGDQYGDPQSPSSALDWFELQKINLSDTTVLDWDTLADRPSTSQFAGSRGSRFDEFHIIVFDDEKGSITGNAFSILEKHLNVSKAKNAEYSAGSPSYWRKYLVNASTLLFGGSQPEGVVATGFVEDFELFNDGGWDQDAESVIFDSIGSKTYTLTNGLNYNGQTGITTAGALSSPLAKIVSGYTLFENTEETQVDFILMGSAGYAKEDAQALANKVISVAEIRKDALAFISPYRGALLTDTTDQNAVTVRDIDTITNNIVDFYGPITSTTYAVFDSGYKYMYDRFNDTFRYVPLNGDIAGCCARSDINQFPWFSPAGTSRGTVLNAVKLPYNPGKVQRDKLYTNRINPVIVSPGAGIILFGDKTGFGKSSAFDRINVRRLFIYLENAIAFAARDQLFEFNDEVTRTNFVNIIEPFLRDVQSKRGIFDYVVICDETNNTAAVIDNNEFVADIYVKPARSINFIGLTFIATRTGVAFEEVIGTV